LTVTFSAIDWVMSLEPQWYSTIYGMIFMTSHGVMAMAFIIAAMFFLASRQPLSEVVAPWIFQDPPLGRRLADGRHCRGHVAVRTAFLAAAFPRGEEQHANALRPGGGHRFYAPDRDVLVR
jgi:hypothetical protein